jgi:FKBP-type peptidyl-prolyl cis-trans isomerase
MRTTSRLALPGLLLAALAGCPGAVFAQVDAAAESGNFSVARQAAAVDGKAASYSLGLYFGSQLHSSGVQDAVSVDELLRGLREGLAGKVPSEQDKERMNDTLRTARAALAGRSREQAKAFLAENGKVAGVVTTASGLQYSVFKAGDADGKAPGPTDRVTIQYRGHLLDGTLFDSSEQHAMAATFSLNGGVIPGWKQALQLMKPGAQWRVFVPPDLAYGNSTPPGIPAGSLLVYDMQLLKIEPQQPMPAGKPKPAPAAPAHKTPH